MNEHPPGSTLVMGIGNYLMGDEGLGVHLVNGLLPALLPPGTTVVDGGTGGFYLLEYFENHEHVVLVDATLDGNPPGTIRLIRPRFAADFPPAMSTHDIGLKDLVSALQLLDKMPRIDLFVVSIASIRQQGTELSREIANALPRVARQISDLLFRQPARTGVTPLPA